VHFQHAPHQRGDFKIPVVVLKVAQLMLLSTITKASVRNFRLFNMSTSVNALEWKPPAKIEELFAATAGNKFAAINSPVAGAREEKELPVGSAPVQLYSLFTPNGIFHSCWSSHYLSLSLTRSYMLRPKGQHFV